MLEKLENEVGNQGLAKFCEYEITIEAETESENTSEDSEDDTTDIEVLTTDAQS